MNIIECYRHKTQLNVRVVEGCWLVSVYVWATTICRDFRYRTADYILAHMLLLMLCYNYATSDRYMAAQIDVLNQSYKITFEI